MKYDLNKLAGDIRQAMAERKSFTLPSMTVRDFGALIGLLRGGLQKAA